jgi:hypothetical protein
MLFERVRLENTESASSTSSIFEKKGDSKFPKVPSPILSNERRRLSNSESRTLPFTDKSWESRLEASVSLPPDTPPDLDVWEWLEFVLP